MKSYMEELMDGLYDSLQIKKDNLIKEKLIERGFPQYAETFGTERFPKVCCEKRDDWWYYWADDGSQLGKFIVAIEDFKIVSPPDTTAITINFRYMDTLNALPK